MPHDHFIESYQRASIQFTEEEFRKHEQGVDELAQAASVEDALAMVRLYLRKDVTAEADGRVRGPFRRLDHTFPPRNAVEQVRLLAGETLYQMTTLPATKATTVAALALLANADAEGELHVVEHLRPAFMEYLQREGDQVRRSTLSKAAKIPGFDKGLLNRLLKVSDAAGLVQELAHLSTFFANLDGRLKSVQDEVDRNYGHLSAIAEETDILWHMLGETCALGWGEEVAGKYPKAVAVAVAFELATLTKLLPPPTSYKQLLRRELRGFGGALDLQVRWSEAFNELPKKMQEDVRHLPGYSKALDLSPVLSAFNTDQDELINEDNLMALCSRLYIEFLLAKAIGEDA